MFYKIKTEDLMNIYDGKLTNCIAAQLEDLQKRTEKKIHFLKYFQSECELDERQKNRLGRVLKQLGDISSMLAQEIMFIEGNSNCQK